MATSAMAPEIRSSQSDENGPGGLRPGAGISLVQVVCVAILILSDLSAIALALELAIIERTHLMSHATGRSQLLTLPFRHYLDLGWLWLLMIVFIGVEGLYTKRRSSWNEIGHVTKAIGVGFVAILASVTLAQLGPDVSRATLVLMALNLFILLPIARFWTKRFLGTLGFVAQTHIDCRGLQDFRSVAHGGELDFRILSSAKGMRLWACWMTTLRNAVNAWGLARVRTSQFWAISVNCASRWNETQAKDVLIALPELSEMKLLALVHKVQLYCDSIYVVPALWGLPMMNLQVDGFLHARLMMLKLSNNLAKPWNTWLKRGLDLIVGAVITLFALPLGVLLAILIRIDSDGAVIFTQDRLGRQGANFPCLKFRNDARKERRNSFAIPPRQSERGG